MTISYERQTGIIDIEDFRENKIAIIGCGAIGSFLGMSLAKMGLTDFLLCDFDKVEPHNLPNQFFDEYDIGSYKVHATANHMNQLNSKVKIDVANCKFDSKHKFHEQIIIACVDKMEVRKQIFENCKKNKTVQLFIDTRMGGLEGQIYFVEMSDKKEIENYEKSLFTDGEAVQLRCTERSIIFTVLGIVSFVCSELVKALKGEEIRNYLVIDYKGTQVI